MSILITCIGIPIEKAPVIQYNNGEIKAKNTSEACCKYLLSENSDIPELVITLCLPDAYSKSLTKIDQIGYFTFKRLVLNFCKDKGIAAPVFKVVRVTKTEEAAGSFVSSIYKVKQLLDEKIVPADTQIIIDTSQNTRTVSSLIRMLTHFLNSSGYQNTACYYADPDKAIISEDKTDDQLEMIEAISEFCVHGTADSISNCFERHSGKKVEPHIFRLIEAIKKFGVSVSLCQTERLAELLNSEVLPLLRTVENIRGASALKNDVTAFRIMADDIRKEFGITAEMESPSVTPVDIIKWRLAHGYLQQAATMFCDSIPKYLVNTNIIIYDHPLKSSLNTPEVNLLYSQIISVCNNNGTERNKEQLSKIQKLALMKQFLQTGSIGSADKEQLEPFLSTMEHFSDIIGKIRPLDAIRDYKHSNEAEKKLMNIIRSTNPETYAGFLNSILLSKQTVLEQFFLSGEEYEEKDAEISDESSEQSDVISKKLANLRNFSFTAIRRRLKGIKLYIYRDKAEEFRKFLAFYVYIKKAVRNYLNHAKDGEVDLTPEQIKEFQSYSIHTGPLTIENIKANITEALKCLDDCIIKNPDELRPVQKYYMTLPKQQRSALGSTNDPKLPLKSFSNPMDSPLLNYSQTKFPIIPLIANTVKPGDVIMVYGINLNTDDAYDPKIELFGELNDLMIEKDFYYEYEEISTTKAADINVQLELFRKLTSTVTSGDKLYIDMTFVEHPVNIVQMMFMNHILHHRKDVSVEAAICGQYYYESQEYALFDMTKLIYADHAISDLGAETAESDVLSAVMSYGKHEENKECCIPSSNDTEAAGTGKADIDGFDFTDSEAEENCA